MLLPAVADGAEVDVLTVPVFEKPIVSVVIPVYNQFGYTYNCIKSIVQNSGDVPYEILIADDCSTDRVHELEKYVTGITVIHNEKNLRFLRNCNHAASRPAVTTSSSSITIPRYSLIGWHRWWR